MPAGVPPEAAEAARGTLGGAVAASESLPPDVRDQLLSAAREAFSRGFERAAVICAVLAAGLALVVLVVLRDAHTRPGGTAEAGSKEAA
jgi:DHA2 family multidrug resistance protein-like MFS transporter